MKVEDSTWKTTWSREKEDMLYKEAILKIQTLVPKKTKKVIVSLRVFL